MDWKMAATAEGGAIRIPKSWLHLHYYDALNILFRTENALRVFAYVILKNEKHEDWSNTSIQIDEEGNQSSIAATARRRINQAKAFGYLGYDLTSPLMYLTSGELTRMILSDALWPCFARYFKANKDIIRTKLDEINNVRNALAHFRPIKPDDIDLIKQNVRHAFVGIEECLADLIGTQNIVPTNNSEDWYVNLSKLKAKRCGLAFHQSGREDWIRLLLTFKAEIVTQQAYGDDWWSYKLLSVVTPSIPKNYSNVRKFCTYVGEYVPYATTPVGSTDHPDYSKHISIVFKRSILVSNFQDIQADMTAILAKIDEEGDLLQQDHLARGQLVETQHASRNLKTTEKGQRWWDSTSNLERPFREDDPTEYWGDITTGPFTSSDFITAAAQYPWMTTRVAQVVTPWD
jgi:hypothetical protein